MTTTQELLKSSFELNLNNYGPEDVERLNDWAIEAYAALETAQAEVARLIRDRDSVWALKEHKEVLLSQMTSERDAALARLAEIERQERIGVVSETWARWPDKGNVVVVDWVKDTPPIGASIYAGASPVEPSQAGELSDEEILAIYDVCNSGQYGTLKQRFARAIIAAINAKGPTT